ncbi:TPA: hypothetical protein ACW7WN_004777, partial [Enterobacter cloacae]
PHSNTFSNAVQQVFVCFHQLSLFLFSIGRLYQFKPVHPDYLKNYLIGNAPNRRSASVTSSMPNKDIGGTLSPEIEQAVHNALYELTRSRCRD